MKTIKGALGMDPGRTKRMPMSQPPAKGSGMLGQYHRQQQMQQQMQNRPQPQTGGPMFAPQMGAGIGNFMQNQVGAQNQAGAYGQAVQQMQPQQMQQAFANAQNNPYAPQAAGQVDPRYAAFIANRNANGVQGMNAPSVGDMTAQQRNPNYIQGR